MPAHHKLERFLRTSSGRAARSEEPSQCSARHTNRPRRCGADADDVRIGPRESSKLPLGRLPEWRSATTRHSCVGPLSPKQSYGGAANAALRASLVVEVLDEGGLGSCVGEGVFGVHLREPLLQLAIRRYSLGMREQVVLIEEVGFANNPEYLVSGCCRCRCGCKSPEADCVIRQSFWRPLRAAHADGRRQRRAGRRRPASIRP